MKKLLILTVLAITSLNVLASEGREEHGGWSPTANIANTNSNNIGGANLVSNFVSERNPVSSAIAPNVYSSVVCPIINQSSHAAQTIIFGASTTGTPTVNAICVAFNLNQVAVVEKMTCASDAAYRRANPNCN